LQSFDGARIVFRAIRRIDPGEQVTISYVALAAPRPERRRTLRTLYFFDIDDGGRRAARFPFASLRTCWPNLTFISGTSCLLLVIKWGPIALLCMPNRESCVMLVSGIHALFPDIASGAAGCLIT
jgi:hypothetical protein